MFIQGVLALCVTLPEIKIKLYEILNATYKNQSQRSVCTYKVAKGKIWWSDLEGRTSYRKKTPIHGN